MRHVVKGVSIIRKVALPAYLMYSVLFYTCKIAPINVRLFAGHIKFNCAMNNVELFGAPPRAHCYCDDDLIAGGTLVSVYNYLFSCVVR